MRLDLLRMALTRAVSPLGVTARADVADRAGAPVPQNPARLIQRGAAAVAGLAALPQDLGDAAVAGVLAGVPAVALPAAVVGALYVGLPHAHGHPPSLVPPAPPVPLPSVGAVTLGGCPRVLIRGLPAVRAGDLGLAPSCGGLAPLFEVVTGSSKVFIAGSRAARAGDLVRCCVPPVSHGGGPGVATMASAMALASGAVADGLDAAVAEEPAVAGALALSAGMACATAAVDAAVASARAAQGTDPALGPAAGVLVTGTPTVLIGGLPTPNVTAVISGVLARLRARTRGAHRAPQEAPEATVGCQDC